MQLQKRLEKLEQKHAPIIFRNAADWIRILQQLDGDLLTYENEVKRFYAATYTAPGQSGSEAHS